MTKLHFDEEWLRRKIEEGCDDPPACAFCGAMAGACAAYPNCPNGPHTHQFEQELHGTAIRCRICGALPAASQATPPEY